jgi:hypothetical protein
MNNLYLIQYDIKSEDKIVERIKSLGSWMKYFPQSMIIDTSLNAQQIYDRLKVDYENTRILVIKINKSDYYGWMPTEAWNWLIDK